jgi:hypothetical protein
MPENSRAELIEKIAAKLEALPLPAWRKPSPKRAETWYSLQSFKTFRAHRLRADYSELELNLRSVFSNFGGLSWFDLQSADQAVDILDVSRQSLEEENPNADVIDDDLGRARRLMVWLTPREWLNAQASAIRARLDSSGLQEARDFKLNPDVDDANFRFRLDEAIALTNRIAANWATNNGLQLRRLELVRNLGAIAVFVLVLLSPVLVDGKSLADWRRGPLDTLPPVALAWITTLGLALVGATGALLSSLLQARDLPVTFADYQVRGLEMSLRILVGTIVAIVLYFLLSWQVLPVISVVSPGTYLFVAFLSGFSERYFLGLLGLEKTEQRLPPAPVTPSAAPPNLEEGRTEENDSQPKATPHRSRSS